MSSSRHHSACSRSTASARRDLAASPLAGASRKPSADAIPLVKENPYRLARDIRGIGFKTADELAQKLGIPKTSMLRARAGISYALLQAIENGDCGLPEEDLLTLAERLLEIGRDTLAEALRLEI